MNALTGLMMVVALTLTISACGGGDDAPTSTDNPANNGGNGSGGNGGGGATGAFQGAKRVFGNNLVKAFGREGYDRYTVGYDANGFVTKIHRDRYSTGTTVDRTEEWQFTYSNGSVTCAQYRDGSLRGNYVVNIGANGFASSSVRPDGSITAEYDAEGHIIKQTYTETGRASESIIWNWQNGDIVSGGWQNESVSVAYTSPAYPNAIANVAGYIEFDHSMGFDMDDDVSFVTGLMGYGPKHLPMAWSDRNTSATNTWTLDGMGRATKVVVTTNNSSTYTHYWEF